MKYRSRDILLREAILGILGADRKGGSRTALTRNGPGGEIETKYCRMCRAAKRDHCETCDKAITELK